MTPVKYITALITPGLISDTGLEILKFQYEDIESNLILMDGLNIRRDEQDINKFYLLCPSSVSKEKVVEFITKAKDILTKNGVEKPEVIFLPDGLYPKTI